MSILFHKCQNENKYVIIVCWKLDYIPFLFVMYVFNVIVFSFLRLGSLVDLQKGAI